MHKTQMNPYMLHCRHGKHNYFEVLFTYFTDVITNELLRCYMNEFKFKYSQKSLQ